MMLYGFLIGLAIILLGFGTRYVELIDERTPLLVVQRDRDDAERLRVQARSEGADQRFPTEWAAVEATYSGAITALELGKKSTALKILQRVVKDYQRLIESAEFAKRRPIDLADMRLVVQVAHDSCVNHAANAKSQRLLKQADQVQAQAEQLADRGDFNGAISTMHQAQGIYTNCYTSGDFSPPSWVTR